MNFVCQIFENHWKTSSSKSVELFEMEKDIQFTIIGEKKASHHIWEAEKFDYFDLNDYLMIIIVASKWAEWTLL